MFDIHNHHILITGAAGHLGSAISRQLAQAGAVVLLNGRDEAKLEKLSKEIAEEGGSSAVLACDLCKKDAPAELIRVVKERYGRLDGIINNAYAGKTGKFEDIALEDYRESYDVTVGYPAVLLKEALPLLKKSPQASVVNVASMYGMVSPDLRIYGDSGYDNPPHYGAAKAALIQLTRYLACQYAQEGIRINSVSPGPFPPETVAEKHPEFYQNLTRKVPIGRIGKPEELSGVVQFLLSPAASYITGANIPVDGGWTAW